MASLQEDPSGNYHVCFRFGGKRFKRSLHTKSEREAGALAGRIEDNIRLVDRGAIRIPDGADIPTILMSDGQLSQRIQVPHSLTLAELIDRYLSSLPPGAIEDSTRYTIGVHVRHLKRILGDRFPVRALTRDDLQRYVNRRTRQRSRRGGHISPITIRKEITTLSGIWTWAVADGVVESFPNKGLKYPKSAEKPPFQTWQEIEKQIARGGLSEAEQAELWDCLFLDLREVAELLAYVDQAAQQPFIYPMFVMAAHTGARRSELTRSRRADFDDDTVIIHERKRTKGKYTTRRVSLSSLLRQVMDEWFSVHPGGQYTFCQHQVVRSKKSREEPQPVTRDEAHDHLRRTLAGSKWERLRGWHILRHSFISNCALKGIDQRIIDSFVGHTTEEMRKRYTHLFPSSKQAAIKSVFG